MPKFASPNQDQDKKFLEEEAARKGFDWKTVFWKPKPSKKGEEIDNVIRIMPARGTSGATYHLKIGKHFVKHGENDLETFICLAETYGKACPACEEAQRIYAEAKAMSKENGDRHRKLAAKFSVKRLGIFNIIDRLAYQDFKEGRLEKLPKVLMWESPRKLGWERIVRNVSSRGRTWQLFDQYDESGALVKPGRDVLVKFYPESDPSTMYDIQYLDPQPLGTEAEVAIWYDQIIDLLPEKISIYASIPYEEARIKTMGSKDERDHLRAEKQRMREEAQAARREAEASATDEPAETGVSEPIEEESEPEQEAEPVAAAAPKPTPAPKPAAAPTSGDNELKARIAAVKERMAKGGKA